MKAPALILVVWTWASCVLSMTALRADSNRQPESAPSTPASADQKPIAAKKTVSAGIADILKMAERGLDSSVIKSFVENYPVAYNPTADEIIALHDAGISSDIIAAMLRHNGELRAKQLEANGQGLVQRGEVRKPSVMAEAPQNNAPVVAPQPTTPASQVTYVYPSYTYPTYYPTYSYGYTLPLYYSSSYCYRPYYYSHYSYWPRSCSWPLWPSWPSYGVNIGFRSSYYARPAFASHSFPHHPGHFVRR